jgi:2-dehydro-3-deoxyphosphooctonate aldolase (KDO 8-P synthase)
MAVSALQKTVSVGKVTFGNQLPFVLISGPCQIESRDHAMTIAEFLSRETDKAGVPFVFKASYDKANRTSLKGQRGVGIDKGLAILDEIRSLFGCPVLTDIHDIEQAQIAARVVDIIQIPAFLSRQTDLLLAAGETGACINVKKGQFLAPWDMANVADKIASTGNQKILLCDRGTSFGYGTLITDFRGIPVMQETGYPVVFDATHSVQEPGGRGTSSGGKRDFAPTLARAALAVGCAAVFAEAHDNPDQAPSDGPNMLPLDWIAPFLADLKALDAVSKSRQLTASY